MAPAHSPAPATVPSTPRPFRTAPSTPSPPSSRRRNTERWPRGPTGSGSSNTCAASRRREDCRTWRNTPARSDAGDPGPVPGLSGHADASPGHTRGRFLPRGLGGRVHGPGRDRADAVGAAGGGCRAACGSPAHVAGFRCCDRPPDRRTHGNDGGAPGQSRRRSPVPLTPVCSGDYHVDTFPDQPPCNTFGSESDACLARPGLCGRERGKRQPTSPMSGGGTCVPGRSTRIRRSSEVIAGRLSSLHRAYGIPARGVAIRSGRRNTITSAHPRPAGTSLPH